MTVLNLEEGRGRAVFKGFNHDLRQYKTLSMFYHAESLKQYARINDGEVYAVVRLGTDYINHYYEIKYPLKTTPFGSSDENVIWPIENELSFDLQTLVTNAISKPTIQPRFIEKESMGKYSPFTAIPILLKSEAFLQAWRIPKILLAEDLSMQKYGSMN
jgi:cell surface protein SprA